MYFAKKDCEMMYLNYWGRLAKFGSVSQNNMERAGLRIDYTKAIWVKK
ncbi:hypothetical protein V7266_30415 [Neobacillus drentensis]